MDLIELKSNIRTTKGNGPNRALRRDGKMPAVLYGPDTAPMSLSVGIAELELIIKQSSSGQVLINLSMEDGATRPVMLKELQKHPVSRNLLHADFYEIAMDRKLTVKVPVTTVGKSKGVELGGMLQVIRRELEVSCFPNDIPETIEIDITDMDVGYSLHVLDIPTGGKFEFPTEVNFTVLTILSRKLEVEEVEEEEGIEGEEGAEETAEEGAEA